MYGLNRFLLLGSSARGHWFVHGNSCRLLYRLTISSALAGHCIPPQSRAYVTRSLHTYSPLPPSKVCKQHGSKKKEGSWQHGSAFRRCLEVSNLVNRHSHFFLRPLSPCGTPVACNFLVLPSHHFPMSRICHTPCLFQKIRARSLTGLTNR